MLNNCRFNICPLIIAILLGGIITTLVFLGTISIALITALLPILLAISGFVLLIISIFIVNLNNIQDNEIQRNKCCPSCCICPLLRTAIVTLVILVISSLLGLIVTLTVGSILSAILVFIIATSLIYLFFIIIELFYCILSKICND